MPRHPNPQLLPLPPPPGLPQQPPQPPQPQQQNLVLFDGSAAAERKVRSDNQTVTLKIGQIRLIHDCLERAAMACKQSERISYTLANQFGSEVHVLNEAKEVLSGFLSRADDA